MPQADRKTNLNFDKSFVPSAQHIFFQCTAFVAFVRGRAGFVTAACRADKILSIDVSTGWLTPNDPALSA